MVRRRLFAALATVVGLETGSVIFVCSFCICMFVFVRGKEEPSIVYQQQLWTRDGHQLFIFRRLLLLGRRRLAFERLFAYVCELRRWAVNSHDVFVFEFFFSRHVCVCVCVFCLYLHICEISKPS